MKIMAYFRRCLLKKMRFKESTTEKVIKDSEIPSSTISSTMTTTTSTTSTVGAMKFFSAPPESKVFLVVDNDVSTFHIRIEAIDLVFIMAVALVFLLIVGLVCKYVF